MSSASARDRRSGPGLAAMKLPIPRQRHDDVRVAVIRAEHGGALRVGQLQPDRLFRLENPQKLGDVAGVKRNDQALSVVTIGSSTFDSPISAARLARVMRPGASSKSTPRLSSLVTICACRTAE